MPKPIRYEGPVVSKVRPGNEWWFGDGNEAVVEDEFGESISVGPGDTSEEIEIAQLIAAAINSAIEADKMGFDMVAAIEALPKMLHALMVVGQGQFVTEALAAARRYTR